MNTIKLGSTGEEVKVLQRYLGINPDGNFGPVTDKKVREWQKSKGLTPDGVVGPHSWSIIFPNGQIATTTKPEQSNNIGISNGMINFICQWETGHKFGYTMT